VSTQDQPSLTEGFQSPFVERGGDDVTRLVAVAGPLNGSTFELRADELTIGRRPDNTIPIPLRSVSKTHCRLRRVEGDRFVVSDEGSRNGTFVNGRRLEAGARRELIHGDTIAVCETTFLFLASRFAARMGPLEAIEIDRRAAGAEADRFLGDYDELLAVARARRQRRGGTAGPTAP
jgi:pSer/pThr/pTyr-binding forkhead associated (FHA) protein